MNRLKLLFAVGATVAVLASEACNQSAPPAAKSQRSNVATAPPAPAPAPGPGPNPLHLQFDVLYPAALPGEQFPVDVSVRDASGNLMDVTDSVTVALKANPTATTLQGTATVAAVHGVASFNLAIPAVGTGYSLTASATNDAPAASAAFDVTWSQDDRQTVGLAPNNSTSSAQLISPKVPIFGTLGPGEVHYYKFRAKFGQVLSVASFANRLDQGNWDTSLRLRLLAPDGTTEIQRSGAIDPEVRRVDNDILQLRVPKDGDYYLACDADQVSFASGKYAVLIGFPSSPALQIEAEAWGVTGSNDTLSTAEALQPGVLYGHYDYVATNTAASDFYKFSVGGSTRVHLELVAARNGAAYGDLTWGPRLELQDSTGAVLAADETGYYRDPAIDYIFTTSATYYVRVTRSGAATNTGSSPYFLSYKTSAYAPVTATTGNTTSAKAMAIKYGADVSGSFGAAGDQYFAFGGTAGDVVRLVFQDKAALQSATIAYGYPSSGKPIGIDPPPPTSSPTSSAAAAPAPTPAPGPTPVPGPVPRPVPNPVTAEPVLLGSDGITVLSNGGYSVLQTILQTNGTYFVRVRSGGAGSFGIRVDLVASSPREVEPNDTAAQANVIGATGWISGAIGAAGDTDHFKVHAEARQLVTVSLYAAAGAGIGTTLSDWGSGLVPNLEVRDPKGSPLSAAATDRKGDINFAESFERNGPMLETSFRAVDAGDYEIVVSDADGTGGPNYFYALQIWKNK